jgi:hypothetical protein
MKKMKGSGTMMLLPPAKDKCQVCATDHDSKDPHNAQSLFYQMKFKMENGREASWLDAMSHCDQKIKDAWRDELIKIGVDVDGGKVNPTHKHKNNKKSGES